MARSLASNRTSPVTPPRSSCSNAATSIVRVAGVSAPLTGGAFVAIRISESEILVSMADMTTPVEQISFGIEGQWLGRFEKGELRILLYLVGQRLRYPDLIEQRGVL